MSSNIQVLYKPLSLVFIIGLCILTSCLRKPKACIVDQEAVETGREMMYRSCTENARFQTWNFGDKRPGAVADSALHTYGEEGKFNIELTAYARGAYDSDVATSTILSSYRYVDHVDVYGELPYSSLIFRFDLDAFNWSCTPGVYNEAEPFVIQFWPTERIKIPMEKKNVALRATKSGSTYYLLDDDIHFENNTKNPLIISNGEVTMKMYWTFDNG